MASQRMTLTAWSLLLFIAALWGGAFFLGKIAVSELQPLTLVYFRVTIAAVTLWGFVGLTKTQFPLSLKWALRFLVLGSINNIVPFTLIFWGQQYIASGLASILNAFTPIFTMLVMQVLTNDEKLTSVKIFEGALGIVGVGILIGQDALAGSGGLFSLNSQYWEPPFPTHSLGFTSGALRAFRPLPLQSDNSQPPASCCCQSLF